MSATPAKKSQLAVDAAVFVGPKHIYEDSDQRETLKQVMTRICQTVPIRDRKPNSRPTTLQGFIFQAPDCFFEARWGKEDERFSIVNQYHSRQDFNIAHETGRSSETVEGHNRKLLHRVLFHCGSPVIAYRPGIITMD
jgi:hypothetical protein